MSEELLVRHCAPTLAGLKSGSLFTCPYETVEEMREGIRTANRWLVPKGLRAVPLRYGGKRALIYLYRPKKLEKELQNETAVTLLKNAGYEMRSCNDCVIRLIEKVRNEPDFPHEIGLFLGYPPEDVWGFIHHNACGHKCVGCWKVYGDEEAARKTFAKYKKCTRVYCSQWASGRPIQRLTVAG